MSRVSRIVSTWSVRTEAVIVLGVAFGYVLLSTAWRLVGYLPNTVMTERHLRALLVYEPAVLLILGGFLLARGWTLKRLGLRPALVDTVIGIGLAFAAYAAYVGLWMLASAAKLPPAYLNGARTLIGGHFNLLTVIAVSLVNPLFEELFVCGYLITVAKESGHVALGVNASVAIRLAYHLYQGGVGVVAIVPFGLILAIWYSKTGRLWPVLVAHALTDFTGLAAYIG